MAQASSNQHNPALKPLGILVGDWEIEISNASFLPDQSDTAKGPVSFEWVQDGAFLLMHMGDKAASTPSALWLISRDDAAPDYIVFYYDDRSVSRVYGMSYADGVWKMWRAAPSFSQRFEGKLSDDGNTVTASWQKSLDDTTWEHDFDVTYTRR
jgi:hypothetical protein